MPDIVKATINDDLTFLSQTTHPFAYLENKLKAVSASSMPSLLNLTPCLCSRNLISG